MMASFVSTSIERIVNRIVAFAAILLMVLGFAAPVSAVEQNAFNYDAALNAAVGAGSSPLAVDQAKPVGVGSGAGMGIAREAAAFLHPSLDFVAPRLTGTVWDDVVETGVRHSGTEVPTSFRLALDDGTEVWMHPNATKHMAERVLNGGAVGPVTTQSQIRSLQSALSDVNRQGVSLGQMYNVNGWEFQFSIRATDDLVVVNHALYTG
jgi:hypothetical protein